MTHDFEVELFFDGACPLCAREVRALRRLDRRGRLRFTDIAAPGFEPAEVGRSRDELMAKLHARLPDGTWLVGVETFRRAYAAVGFGPLVALSRLPGVSWALDRAYDVFARNRLRWTGRCEDGACALPRAARQARPDAVGTAFVAASAGVARTTNREGL